MNELLTRLSEVSPQTWEVIGTAIVASGVLSPALMAVKKLFTIKREFLMAMTVITACFAVGAIAYLKDVAEYNPAIIGLCLTVGTNLAYYGFWKPVTRRYAPKLADLVDNARAYKAQRKTVTPVVTEETPGRISL